MSEELNQDDLVTLANLLLISSKVKAREALCRKIGISYYIQVGAINDPSEESFAINLINHLKEVGNTQAICQICKELEPIFKGGQSESILHKIVVKLNCTEEYSQNYPNNKQPTVPSSIPASRGSVNPFNQLAKNKLITGGAIILIVVAVFQTYKQTTLPNPRYAQLQNLLSAEKWKEADDETAHKMWEVAGRQSERSLRAEDFEKFPCEDLHTIDTLWVKYSKEHFGFGVQKRIWLSSDVNSDLGKFVNQVGWGQRKEDGSFFYWFMDGQSFDLSAPAGKLPWAVTYYNGNNHTRIKYMSRIISCGI